MKMRRLTGAVLGLAMSAVTAAPASAADKETRQMMADIRILQEQSQQLQNLIATLNESIKAVNTRIDEQTGASRKSFADQKLVIDNLASDLRVVREKVFPVDAQLIEQLKWSAEVVCSAFHVPAYKVGVGSAPSYNNIEALNQQYYSQCLQKLFESIEELLDIGLGLRAHAAHEYGVEFDLDNLLRMDTATRVKTLADGIKGAVLKPNEARANMNLPPVEGGDEVYLQQQNYSLAALAKRDAKDDPFASPTAAPADTVPPDAADNDNSPEALAATRTIAGWLARDMFAA